MKLLLVSLLLVAPLSTVAIAAPVPQPLQRCEPNAYIYQWRDASGQLQMGDCAPEGVQDVRAVARSSLQPTIIQPPPKPKRSPARKTRKRASKSKTKSRGLSTGRLRSMSAKCRWLVGRVEHLKGLGYGIWTNGWQPPWINCRCRKANPLN